MKGHTLITAMLAAGLLAVPAGCVGTDSDPDCAGGKCDDLDLPDSEVDPHACDGIFKDDSGRNHRNLVNRLSDPFIDFVYKAGSGCPGGFSGIMDKLRETDSDSCGSERAGINTRVVSETAQLLEKPTNYRLVTTRACGGRPAEGLIFSLFGVGAGAANLPESVEVMAFDESQGVFNYYETHRDGTVSFFGNSKDMLVGAGGGTVRRCAQCHTGGGAVMKELDTPWLHWEGHMDIPGAREIVEAHANLGTKQTGLELEGLVKRVNRKWNEARLEHVVASGTVADVLRPLFCTVEINLDNGAGFFSPADMRNDEGASGCNVGQDIDHSRCDNMRSIPFDSMLDPQLKSFGSINIDFADYEALIRHPEVNQRVAGRNGVAHVNDRGNPTIDTVFDYLYVERSHADNDYVEKLKGAGIVDDKFIKDVLMVDFTRPVFSDERCRLLDFAPSLTSEEMVADVIRQGFIENLGSPAPGSPEADLPGRADLLANLLAVDADHTRKVDAFLDECRALDPAEFLRNAYTVTTLIMRKARAEHVMEFPETSAINDLVIADATRLHPETCELTVGFVSVSPDEPPPPPTDD